MYYFGNKYNFILELMDFIIPVDGSVLSVNGGLTLICLNSHKQLVFSPKTHYTLIASLPSSFDAGLITIQPVQPHYNMLDCWKVDFCVSRLGSRDYLLLDVLFDSDTSIALSAYEISFLILCQSSSE